MVSGTPDLPTGLAQNVSILSPSEMDVAKHLVTADQGHLFEQWPEPGVDDAGKHRMMTQAAIFESRYPGGIQRYVSNAKTLLKASSTGVNPFEGFVPSVPIGETLHFDTPELDEAERLGVSALPYVSFVLVAGGLGERLGYKGIKISLPINVISGESYIQYYIEFILAYQDRAREMTGNADLHLPLAIMTSDDTDASTVDLMKRESYFGMDQSQVTIVKQDKVPALVDNDAHFALSGNDPFNIIAKPHGHGDVHTLLHQNNVIANWIAQYDTKYVFFFQDTNGIVFRSLPAALGMTVKNGFDVNSLTVPRKPGEAVGAICTLTSPNQTLTVNVEYNQLDPLLRATISPEGDVPDPNTGYSPYPGNINALILAAGSYNAVLKSCGGSVPEFCNPKYADSSKTKFKSPTRLECMMQDYPRLLPRASKVGFTQIDRRMAFSPVKNNMPDGVAKLKATGFSETAAAAESDLFLLNTELLRLGGSKVVVNSSNRTNDMSGIPVTGGPRIVLAPSLAVTQQEMRDILSSSDIIISERSSLCLKGRGRIVIGRLRLDGAILIDAGIGTEIELKSVNETNEGLDMMPIDEIPDTQMPEERIAIRGYCPMRPCERVISTQGALKGERLIVNDMP